MIKLIYYVEFDMPQLIAPKEYKNYIPLALTVVLREGSKLTFRTNEKVMEIEEF